MFADPGDRLECRGDVGARELVVAMTALGPRLHEAAVDELAQVCRCGRRRDPRVAGKLARWKCPSVGERGEHRGPGRMTE